MYWNALYTVESEWWKGEEYLIYWNKYGGGRRGSEAW
jgi:hypothetical protein